MRRLLVTICAVILWSFTPAVFAQTGGEAIGIRIIPNPERLSPLAWYRANVPNPGNPATLVVDGYPAIRDGRSVYIAGTNYDPATSTLYSNIYLISHSDTANQQVQAVFNEFIRQFRLNTNISDTETRRQIRRDLRRATDLSTMQAQLEDYKSKTGTYPRFEGGSYLPNTSYSAWPSWQATLGNLLGAALPVDPRNEFIGCKDPYDSKTCWSAADRKFACPPGSFVYGYRVADDGLIYSLFTNFEYDGPGSWSTTSVSQQSADQCFNFSASDTTDTDADGVGSVIDNCPAINNPDQRDTDGDKKGDACDSCPNDPTNDQDNDGVCGNVDSCPTITNADQTDIDGDGIGDVCDFQTCGNNLTEGSEVCDGQSGVNEFQECAADCRSIRSVGYCGDKIVQTPNEQGIVEECDGNDETQVCAEFINGYKTQRVRACRNTCRFSPFTACQPLESCGDGIVNGLETCDEKEANGVQCTADYAQTCQYCNKVCKTETAQGPRCGDGELQAEQGEECDEGVNNGRRCTPAYGKSCNFCATSCRLDVVNGPRCGDARLDKPYEECDTTAPQAAACEAEPTYFYKDRYCVITPTPQNRACTWGPYEACTQRGSCGDGIVNGPEKCDDAKTPGLCKSCQIVNNQVTATYAVVGDNRRSLCIANKGGWWWGEAGVTTEELAMTCSGAISEAYTRNGQSFGSPWGFAYNASRYKLPYPILTQSITYFHGNCGSHFIMARYGGAEVKYQEFYIPKHGKHCNNDSAMSNMSGDNLVVDEVLANEGGAGGGYIRGQIYLPGSKGITTLNGIVVMEQLRDRSDQVGGALPSDTYRVNYPQGQGYLVWLGNNSQANITEGQSSTQNNNAYVLACVDVDNDRVCDFIQNI